MDTIPTHRHRDRRFIGHARGPVSRLIWLVAFVAAAVALYRVLTA